MQLPDYCRITNSSSADPTGACCHLSVCVVSWNARVWNTMWTGGVGLCNIPVEARRSRVKDTPGPPKGIFPALLRTCSWWMWSGKKPPLLLRLVTWSPILQGCRTKEMHTSNSHFHTRPRVAASPSLMASGSSLLGLYYKAPQTEWLQEQAFIFSQFWRLEGWNQGFSRAF